MARIVITIDIDDWISVSVTRNGKHYSKIKYHFDERYMAIDHVYETLLRLFAEVTR